MTKHIAGLILFSFIVGTSVFISAVTSTERVADVKVNYRVFKKKKKKKRRRHRCRPHRRDVDLTLDKAVFSRQTGLLSTSFQELAPSGVSGIVELHFFSKDRYGTRFLKTESIGYVDLESRYSEPLDWLKRIDDSQNIYVSATINERPSRWGIPPRFDSSKAVRLSISQE